MPAKRRTPKARGFAITEAARERWLQTGGIQILTSGAGIVTDSELAGLIGRLPLVAYPDLSLTVDQLRGHHDET